MRKIFCAYFVLIALNADIVIAQDPHFSQFFSAPQFNNPALIGTQFGEWAVMGNIRQQWGNASTPFNTQALAGEVKFFNQEGKSNYGALGLSLMNDQTMNGSFRSNYISTGFAYHLKLSSNHRLAAGFQGLYGNRRLDYSKLSFSNQFTGQGFDIAVPNRETGLTAMKPFWSISSGLLFTYIGRNGDLLVDIGYSMYDINRPNQSFIKDSMNQLNLRHVGYFNLQSYPEFNDNLFLQFTGIFHLQAIQNYFSVGGAIGINLSEWEKMLLLGCWFREGDAIYPYLALAFNNYQIGLNYDVTISKQNLGPSNPRSLELSFVVTGLFPKTNYWDCPNKRKNVRFPTE